MGDLKKSQFTNLETDIKIGIYQLKSVMECSYAFRPWKEAESKFTISDYTCRYHIYAENSEFMLDDVFHKFNVDWPSDFKGHSLSISDLVRVRDYEEDTDSWFYCDDKGWKDITEIVKAEHENSNSKPGTEMRFYPMLKCRLCGEIFEHPEPQESGKYGELADDVKEVVHSFQRGELDMYNTIIHNCKDGSYGATEYAGHKMMPKHKSVNWD